jgi:hypothetical protein
VGDSAALVNHAPNRILIHQTKKPPILIRDLLDISWRDHYPLSPASKR